MSAPSFMTARVRHELMRTPLARTVQAPHCPWSHPFLVPVRPRYSRRASSRVVHGATSICLAVPFTLRVTRLFVGKGAVAVATAPFSGSFLMPTPPGIDSGLHVGLRELRAPGLVGRGRR